MGNTLSGDGGSIPLVEIKSNHDINERFKQDNIEPKLSGLLKKNRAVIAGSFPLQVLINERWKDSDIDIWVSNKSNLRKLIAGLLNVGYSIPERIKLTL